MLCFTLLVVYGVTTATAAPFNFEPDYEAAILSLQELNPSQSPETAAQRQRKEEQRKRLEGIRRQILEMLNLPCVPRPPTAPSITTDNMRLFNQLLVRLQNQTGPEREGLLKRAQSFYPACEPPEESEALFQQEDSINIYFNLTSFFLTLPAEVTIDVAELRLYNKLAPPRPVSVVLMPDAWDEENDKIRVSIYMYTSEADAEYGGANDTTLVDSVVVSRYGESWVQLNVRAAVRLWSSEQANLGLRLTVEDVHGHALNPEDYFENMDCNGTTPGSPMPGYLLQVAREQEIPVQQQYRYPVLDLRTAEDAADMLPSNGAVPSTAPCPYTPDSNTLSASQPLYATLPSSEMGGGVQERPPRRHRRRHSSHHRRHHRRGGARRQRRGRGRH